MKESAYIISNIAAGTSDDVDHLIQFGFAPILVHLLNNSFFDVKKEVLSFFKI